jgi:hypothetical protein
MTENGKIITYCTRCGAVANGIRRVHAMELVPQVDNRHRIAFRRPAWDLCSGCLHGLSEHLANATADFVADFSGDP